MSPAWSYLTLQVPVLLVIVKVLPEFIQAPALENVTTPPAAFAATPKLVLYVAFAGACVVTLIV